MEPMINALGEQAYKHAQGIHGYPLPGIKAWNNAMKFLKREINPEWTLQGSVEDLSGPCCTECGGEMIRVGTKFNDLFRVGTLRCGYTGRKNLPHAMHYWAEVWPDANFPGNTTTQWNKGEETKFEIANCFKLSDPKIKKCFQRGTLEFYPYLVGMTEDWYKVNKPGERYYPDQLPKPDFVHA